jgi:hypothetical protein
MPHYARLPYWSAAAVGLLRGGAGKNAPLGTQNAPLRH